MRAALSLLTLALVAPCLGQASPQAIQGDALAGLQLTLGWDPVTVHGGGTITLRVVLRSHARHVWLVYTPLQEGEGASYSLRIRDHRTGEEVRPPFIADAMVPPGPVTLRKLLPGKFLQAQSADTLQNFGMLAGHAYDVTAIYHSPIQKKRFHDVPVLSKSDGDLSSLPVLITVIE